MHAAFFVAGILVAFLSGKILALVWNALAGWPEAVHRVPALLRYAEDERDSFTMVAGAVIGVIAVIQTYRKEQIRTWADEVAAELAKVTWPTRETVTNGTIVVVIASIDRHRLRDDTRSVLGISDQPSVRRMTNETETEAQPVTGDEASCRVASKKWYVVTTYSGYENKVKAALQERIRQHRMEERFGEILIPPRP